MSAEAKPQRKVARSIRGRVISDKMEKTRTIQLNRAKIHRLYHKQARRSQHLFVHDEKNQSKQGDLIEAVACRPLSKNKAYRVIRVIEKARGVEA